MTDPRSAVSGDLVRIVYHYRDGHDFTTEPMQRAAAVAHMPLLRAVAIDASHFASSCADIELRSA